MHQQGNDVDLRNIYTTPFRARERQAVFSSKRHHRLRELPCSYTIRHGKRKRSLLRWYRRKLLYRETPMAASAESSLSRCSGGNGISGTRKRKQSGSAQQILIPVPVLTRTFDSRRREWAMAPWFSGHRNPMHAATGLLEYSSGNHNPRPTWASSSQAIIDLLMTISVIE